MQTLMPNIQLLRIEMYSCTLWRLKGSSIRGSRVTASGSTGSAKNFLTDFNFLHLNKLISSIARLFDLVSVAGAFFFSFF